MNFLTLTDIKAQARVDHNYEDDLLTQYGEAAESKIYKDTGYSYAKLLEMSTERTGTAAIDPVLKMAGLMLAATWYRHRENVENTQMYAVPYAYEALISDYVCHTFPDAAASGTETSEE